MYKPVFLFLAFVCFFFSIDGTLKYNGPLTANNTTRSDNYMVRVAKKVPPIAASRLQRQIVQMNMIGRFEIYFCSNFCLLINWFYLIHQSK